VAFAKLYDRKTPLPAADLLNDRVVPLFDSYGIALVTVTGGMRAGSAVDSTPGKVVKRSLLDLGDGDP
jgi:hypothetical protein